MFSPEEIKALIVARLVKKRKWGGSHTEHIIGGLPGHLIGSKNARQALKELVQQGWLIASLKTHEVHYSLNPEKIDEIMRFYYENKDRP